MKKLTSKEIRNMWVHFFESKKHLIIKSSPLIPEDDPTLLWINAGVSPLKKYFDGTKIPPNRRLTNAQKCLRTNDIENVGLTARHHTFFEMLGNFSVGDYFKTEAITWGFELLTSKKYFNFELDKLYFTYYPEDLDTKNLWHKLGVAEDHIIPLEENFWEIGEGPCGPCTEILYDRGEKYDKRGIELIVNDIENSRYVEIWNIVFSSFNAKENTPRSEYKELPSKNIDTGAGLERFVSIIQQTETNFETDLFLPIINHIEKISNIKYTGQKEFKIIADHIRALTFTISDGAVLSNEGRGYVLRRLLRRSLKAGLKLNLNKPFLHLLVDDVVDIMGDYYTEIKANIEIVKNIIKKEEEKFLETLEAGEKEFFKAIKDTKVLSGEMAFKLYDTYGFPIELTIEYSEENNVKVDIEGYKIELNNQKEKSRANRHEVNSMKSQKEYFLNYKDQSKFIGYETLESTSKVIKVFDEGIILDKTPFYAEGGGQIPDSGFINDQEVLDVIKLPNGQHMHVLEKKFKLGETVKCQVDKHLRPLTMYNHSATHLLHRALKDVLGDYVNQHGSKVTPYFLRFDFNCYNFPTDEEILKMEKIVVKKINSNLKVNISYTSQDEAIKKGAIALFGEKYGNTVRMVDMSGYSIELCGGTHVSNTNEIKNFAVMQVESVGSGMYRIFAISGPEINEMEKPYIKPYLDEINDILNKLGKDNFKKLNIKKIPEIKNSYKDIIELKEYLHYLQEVSKNYFKQNMNNNISDNVSELIETINKNKNKTQVIKTNIDDKILRSVLFDSFNKTELDLLFLVNEFNDKITLMCRSNKNNASDLIKLINEKYNTKGGGKNDFATAGGEISNIKELIEFIRKNA